MRFALTSHESGVTGQLHNDVLSFSVAAKPLKMKNKIKSHFILFAL